MIKLVPALLMSTLALSMLNGCHKFSTTTTPMPRYAYLKTHQLPDVMAFGNAPEGFSRTNYLQSSKEIVKDVENGDIQVVNEGHRITLIIPTDKYFVFHNSKELDKSHLNDLKYKQLEDIANLLECFPRARFNIAGFTDNIGSYEYKRRQSKQWAQAILGYLWAKGISRDRLYAQGYGDQYPIANDALVHGSAMNRRVEIQWTIT